LGVLPIFVYEVNKLIVQIPTHVRAQILSGLLQKLVAVSGSAGVVVVGALGRPVWFTGGGADMAGYNNFWSFSD
jgi:hypothetical protein